MDADENNDDSEVLRSLRLEYQLSQEMHMYYGRIVWQIGAIFLPVAFGGFALGIQQNLAKEQFVFLALFITGLLLFFLLSYWRIRWLAFIHIKRCEEIEGKLGISQHSLQHKANDKTITIGDKKIKPQLFSGVHINSIIPIALIAIVWSYVIFLA